MWNGYGRDDEGIISGLRILGHENTTRKTDVDSGSVPLKSVKVRAGAILGLGVVEITQVYKNEGKNPIETVYFFPLESYASVVRFDAKFDNGEIVKGIVKTTEDAAADYKKALKEKKTAFLGEQVKPDVFNIKVGHLNPGVQVEIALSYLTEVKNDPDTSAMRFVLPTTLAPRYVPPGHKAPSDKDNNKISHTAKSNIPLSINLTVTMNEEILSVKSPSHPIVAEPLKTTPDSPNVTKWNVNLRSDVTQMDRDFVVLVTPKEISKPRLYRSITEDGSLAIMAHFIPSFQLQDQPSEFVIVVDRSGSMTGKRIQLAKKTLLLFLHSLPEDCYFNIVGFGSSYRCLFKEASRKYNDESLQTAITHAEKLKADLGGTEIADPMRFILSRPEIPSYVRQVFVLTDGEVWDTEEVIGIVKRHSHHSRVFTLGIGSSASTHLVRGIAAAGGGTCAFVESDDNIAKKVLSQLKNAMQPALSEVSIEWTGFPEEKMEPAEAEDKMDPAETEVAPTPSSSRMTLRSATAAAKNSIVGHNKPPPSQTKQITKYFQAPVKCPPIFDGSQFVTVGIFPKDRHPTGIAITAQSPDGPLKLEMKLTDPSCTEVKPASMLHKFAAAKVVKELEDEEAYLPSAMERELKGQRTLKEEISEIALKNGLASKYTSFVGVREKKDGANNGKMTTTVIPSMVPDGMESQGQDVVDGPMPTSLKGGRCGGSTTASIKRKKGCAGGGRPKGVDTVDCKRGRKRSPSTGSSKPGAAAGKKSRKDSNVSSDESDSSDDEKDTSDSSKQMLDLLKLQSCSGAYKLTEDLSKLLGFNLKTISDGIVKKCKWNADAFATCLALAFLKNKLDSLKDQWELAATKSQKWLVKNFPDKLTDMEAAAEKQIGNVKV